MVKYAVSLTVDAEAVVCISEEDAKGMSPDELANFAETEGIASLNFGDLTDIDIHIHRCDLIKESNKN